MCLHVSLSVMVLYGFTSKKAIWFWLAVAWHAVVDALAVYLGQSISMIAVEGIVGVCAVISLGIVFWIKPKFAGFANAETQSLIEKTETGGG
jgi:uncharacterized membrane protein YhfC